MSKIFISCPFNKYIKEHVFTNIEIKHFTEEVYAMCLEYANEVFLALKREEYGAKPLLSYSCLMDYEELLSSDLIIAIPEDSMGVAVELGWATAMNKKIILILDKFKHEKYIADLRVLSKCTILWHDDNICSVMSSLRCIMRDYKQIFNKS